jgi:hypothetical protein
VTVELPADLLDRARGTTTEDIAATIRHGLELLAAARAQEQLQRLRGRVKVSTDLAGLRRHRV